MYTTLNTNESRCLHQVIRHRDSPSILIAFPLHCRQLRREKVQKKRGRKGGGGGGNIETHDSTVKE